MSGNETLRCPCKQWEGMRGLALFDTRTQTYHCPVCQRTLEIPREASGTAREAPSLGIQSAPHSSPSPDATRLADELSALVEKATPAPWIADDFCMEGDRAVRIGTTDGRDDYYLRSATICECWTNHDDEESLDPRVPRVGVIGAERNAKLIAWLRNNAPAIVKALREVGNG